MRIYILLAVVFVLAPASFAQHNDDLNIYRVAETKWVDSPPSLPKGAKIAVLEGDPGKEGPFVYRVKMPANYKIAPHYHKATENVTVLSGVFFIGMGEKFDQGSGKELPIGGFVSVPPTHRHFAWAGGEETLIQVHGVGPTDITFVNPADDPRKK